MQTTPHERASNDLAIYDKLAKFAAIVQRGCDPMLPVDFEKLAVRLGGRIEFHDGAVCASTPILRREADDSFVISVRRDVPRARRNFLMGYALAILLVRYRFADKPGPERGWDSITEHHLFDRRRCDDVSVEFQYDYLSLLMRIPYDGFERVVRDEENDMKRVEGFYGVAEGSLEMYRRIHTMAKRAS